MLNKMLKRNLIILFCATICISFGASWWLNSQVYGNVKDVQRMIGASDTYSEAEINAAMDEAIAYFRDAFGGCKLLEMKYDEARCLRENDEWAKQYDADQAIVLLSSFDVKAKTAWKQGLSPGETYKNWCWVLVRNGTGTWQLKTWGYG